MATVRMKKGSKYADIFDSPETIAQAQKDGYVLVEEEKKPAKVVDSEPTEEKPVEEKTVKKTPRQ